MTKEPLSKDDLRDALAMHARMSRSTGQSYSEVAREIGSLVIVGALVWVLIGAPGVPAVDAFASTRLAPRVTDGAIALGLVVTADVVGQSWYMAPQFVTALLRFPARVVGRLVSATVLLAGIACVSIVALLPGAYVVHLLGLNAA